MISKILKKSEFSRNVLILMTGTVIAQSIPIAVSPILTRIYTPEDFGVFALYMSVASILSVAATGRYELAIMLPKKNVDALNIVFLSLIISFFMSFISFLFIFFFNEEIIRILNNQELSNLLYSVPFTVFFTGVYQSMNYWFSRNKQYKKISFSRILRSGTGASSNLGLGFFRWSAFGLIFSGILGQFIASIYLFKYFWVQNKKYLNKVKKIKILAFIRIYKNLAVFNLPNALLDGLRLSGINIFISNLFSIIILGQFSLAWRMIQLPTNFIGGSISDVFFQKVSSCKKKDLHPIMMKFIKKAFLLGSLIFIPIHFFAPVVFTLVFGADWKLAGEIASVIAPWLFLNFITSPLSVLYIVLNKQNIMFLFSIFYMLTPLSLIVLFKNFDFLKVLNIVTLSMSVLLLIFIGLIIYYVRMEYES